MEFKKSEFSVDNQLFNWLVNYFRMKFEKCNTEACILIYFFRQIRRLQKNYLSSLIGRSNVPRSRGENNRVFRWGTQSTCRNPGISLCLLSHRSDYSFAHIHNFIFQSVSSEILYFTVEFNCFFVCVTGLSEKRLRVNKFFDN